MTMTFHIKWVLLYISVLVLTKYKNDNPKYENHNANPFVTKVTRNIPIFCCYFIVLFFYCYSYYYTRWRLSAGLKEKCDKKEIKGAYESRTISLHYEHIAGTKGLSWTDTYFDRNDSVIAVFDMHTSLYKSEVLQYIQFRQNLLYFLSIFLILVCFHVDDVDDGIPLSLKDMLPNLENMFPLQDMFPIYSFPLILCHVIASVCNGRKSQKLNPQIHTAVTTEGVVVLRKGVSNEFSINAYIPFTRIREVQQHKRIHHTVCIDLLAKEKEASLCDRTSVVVNYLVDPQAFVKLVEAMKLKHNCDEEVPLVASVVE